MSELMVVLGAAVGAPVRFLVDLELKRRLGEDFPWGTLVVNVVGSLVLGALLAPPCPPRRCLCWAWGCAGR
ncbi:CrcB-like protein involved in camphor resistance [Nocardiopsis sp. L17-MgMaSL7]|nr:CrcB-like protein involved in camphor resistance [Nocardiopsis sp. L17-MgMaSL7]